MALRHSPRRRPTRCSLAASRRRRRLAAPPRSQPRAPPISAAVEPQNLIWRSRFSHIVMQLCACQKLRNLFKSYCNRVGCDMRWLSRALKPLWVHDLPLGLRTAVEVSQPRIYCRVPVKPYCCRTRLQGFKQRWKWRSYRYTLVHIDAWELTVTRRRIQPLPPLLF